MPEQSNGNETRHGDGSFLYIRYKSKPLDPSPDKGHRPLPPGAVAYLCPEIFVTPVDINGNVQAGTDVTVTARIFNGGVQEAHGVHVEFWWFNPTLAFSATIPNQLIGTETVNVRAGNYQDVECPVKWRPVFVNHGHECLVVQCSSPSEGADDLKFPFAAALDRHVGQSNLSVLDHKPGQTLRLTVGNPFRSAELFTVMVSTFLVSGDMEKMRTLNMRDLVTLVGSTSVFRDNNDRRHHELQLQATDISAQALGVRLNRVRKVKQYGQCNQGIDLPHYLHSRARTNPDFTTATLGRSLVEFVLQSDEVRELTVDFLATDVGSNHFLVHHFSQVVAGCDIGGYAVVVPPVGIERVRSEGNHTQTARLDEVLVE